MIQDNKKYSGMNPQNKVLIVGASGLIGIAAMEAFLDAGWDVVATSRRKPVLLSGRSFEYIAADLQTELTARDTFAKLTDITHVVYVAIYEKPNDLVAGWSNTDQITINNKMLHTVLEALVSSKSPLQHVSIMQGTKAYGVHLHPINIPARENDPRDNHPNFFFDQQDYVQSMGTKYGFSWTVWRPQLVIGKTAGALNVLPAIGVYAAITREKGEPFRFPGGPSFVWEMVDADLLGDALRWAAESPKAKNEIFNITNGDVFEWRSLWPAIGITLGVNVGEGYSFSMADYIRKNEEVWTKIVQKYGLLSNDLYSFIGQGHEHADFAFAYGAPAGPVAFLSTIKLRKAGFATVIDSRDAVTSAFQSFIDHKLLPPAYTK